jgi:hypothetical protein
METDNNSYLEGIYFSKISGRIFEASKQKNGSFMLKFADSNEIKIIANRIFFYQVECFEVYDILIDYNDTNFR